MKIHQRASDVVLEAKLQAGEPREGRASVELVGARDHCGGLAFL